MRVMRSIGCWCERLVVVLARVFGEEVVEDVSADLPFELEAQRMNHEAEVVDDGDPSDRSEKADEEASREKQNQERMRKEEDQPPLENGESRLGSRWGVERLWDDLGKDCVMVSVEREQVLDGKGVGDGSVDPSEPGETAPCWCTNVREDDQREVKKGTEGKKNEPLMASLASRWASLVNILHEISDELASNLNADFFPVSLSSLGSWADATASKTRSSSSANCRIWPFTIASKIRPSVFMNDGFTSYVALRRSRARIWDWMSEMSSEEPARLEWSKEKMKASSRFCLACWDESW
jgi:hypothetical protein